MYAYVDSLYYVSKEWPRKYESQLRELLSYTRILGREEKKDDHKVRAKETSGWNVKRVQTGVFLADGRVVDLDQDIAAHFEPAREGPLGEYPAGRGHLPPAIKPGSRVNGRGGMGVEQRGGRGDGSRWSDWGSAIDADRDGAWSRPLLVLFAGPSDNDSFDKLVMAESDSNPFVSRQSGDGGGVSDWGSSPIYALVIARARAAALLHNR